VRQNDVGSVRPGQGTLQYMAPELLRGELCSVESDVYALGMTLFEIVARESTFVVCPA